MEVFIVGLHITLCFFLILVVLLQPGKGADFGAAMGGSSQGSDIFGASGGINLLTKVTAIVAALFMGTSLSLAWFSNTENRGSDIGLEDVLEEAGSDAGGETEETPAPAEETPAPAEEAPAAADDDDSAKAEEAAPEPAPEAAPEPAEEPPAENPAEEAEQPE